MDFRDRVVPTLTLSAEGFRPAPGAAYVFGRTSEPRSLVTTSQPGSESVEYIEVTNISFDAITVATEPGGSEVSLHSRRSLEEFLLRGDGRQLYLDITGLPHHVWAPIVRRALESQRPLKVVYVEPLDYKHSPTPTESEIFDLSVRIAGIAPLPGFVTLSEFNEEKVCLVPLLGFEGTRFAHLQENVHPTKLIVPVVGVPGFRLEFPFYAYQGNKLPLLESRAWKRIRFAAASCPFELFYLLDEILADHPGSALRVALIGTKPHALGAVLFALCRPELVELVYDHPIHREKRSSGALMMHIYDVSPFFEAHCSQRIDANVDR